MPFTPVQGIDVQTMHIADVSEPICRVHGLIKYTLEVSSIVKVQIVIDQ